MSCIVATLWKSLPEEERKQWKSEADKEKELHRKQYPDYQFKPGTCGAKGKVRTHAKTEETVKEQCEIIADQILRAHGRSPTREEGQARKRKEAKKAANASRSRDGLPRARKSQLVVSRRNAANAERDREGSVNIKQEDDDEAEYMAPVLLSAPRRRSTSVPVLGLEGSIHGSFKSNEPSVDMFASWQARINEHTQPPPAFLQEAATATPPATATAAAVFPQPSPQSFAGRRTVNPAALRFNMPSSFGDAAFASPRTVIGGAAMPAPSPRYTLFNVPDRPSSASPISARRPDGYAIDNIDAMLLSPLKSSFYDSRTGSNVGWQSWSRYSYADIALPIMNPRQSIDGGSSRRSSLMYRSQYQDSGDYPATAPDSAHLSLHHTFFSPTMPSFHPRYADSKRHGGGQEEEDGFAFADDRPLTEAIPAFGDISKEAAAAALLLSNPHQHNPSRQQMPARPTSSLADADTTPSLGRLALQ